jgi:uroporphyrinogen III methyltransferase/synthase
VLFPGAEKARDITPAALQKLGASVKVVTAYRNERPKQMEKDMLETILSGKYDAITFTSTSTFENFSALLGKKNMNRIKNSLQCASIGPITSQAILSQGVRPFIEAQTHTIPGLVNAIKEHFTKNKVS